jgi:phosphoribosyl-ATP pyrophosphohydrolase/phosphoribosyl-AMP cyclohydrolase
MQADFGKGNGLLPAIVQDDATGKVLMLGFMNEEALKMTNESGKVTFFSRSKNRLWTTGESSGNYLAVKSVFLDCDKDTFLIKAIPSGPVCHIGSDTCWGEQNEYDFSFLHQLAAVIHDRKNHPVEGSYTNLLFNKGINKIAQKVGEEAVEVIIEAKDDNEQLFIQECADLLFHFLVLLEAKSTPLNTVLAELEKRHNTK